jgi:hypothetical protein
MFNYHDRTDISCRKNSIKLLSVKSFLCVYCLVSSLFKNQNSSEHSLAGGALHFYSNSTVTSKLKCGHPSRSIREFKNPYSHTLKFNMAEFGIPVTEYCVFSYIFSLMCCEIKYCAFY